MEKMTKSVKNDSPRPLPKKREKSVRVVRHPFAPPPNDFGKRHGIGRIGGSLGSPLPHRSRKLTFE